ncbi:MAG: DNA-directed RNA polymerase subunit omega [Bacilli bacterium]
MLYPSIDVLLEKVDSKYRLVKIATERCRELDLEENFHLDKYVSKKNIGRSLEEINAGIITFKEE